MTNPHNPVTIVTGGGNLVTAVDDGGNPVTAVDGGGNLVTLTTSGMNPVTFIGGIGAPFSAPLTSNLTSTGTLAADHTFVRATLATVPAFDPPIRTLLAGEAGHEGGRPVENLFTNTENLADASWSVGNGCAKVGTQTGIGPNGENAEELSFTTNVNGACNQDLTAYVGLDISVRYYMRAVTGTTNIRLRLGNTNTADIPLTTSWKLVGAIDTNLSSQWVGIRNQSGGSSGNIYVTATQAEVTEGKSNKNPGEYVSVGDVAERNVLISSATNPLGQSRDLTGADNANCSIDGATVTVSSGSGSFARINTNNGAWSTDYTTNDELTVSGYVRGVGASVGKTLGIRNSSSGDVVDGSVVLTSSYQRIEVARTKANANPDFSFFDLNLVNGTVGNGESVQIKDIQVDEALSATGYEQVGYPYHGAGVDGVKWYETENGNTESSNVVTEATGSDITADDLLGPRIERAATNYADGDDDLGGGAETIDLTAGGTGDYTLSVSSDAAVTVAAVGATGTGFAQATLGSDVTFNLSVAGTVSLTLDSGTLGTLPSGAADKQVEKGSYATTHIETSGAAATRDKTELEYAITLATNDITIACDWTPQEDTNTTKWVLSSYVDSNNFVAFYYQTGVIGFRKKIAGTARTATKATAISAGTTYRLVGRLDSSAGVDVWVDTVKGTTDATATDAVVGTALELGALTGGSQTTQNVKLVDYYDSALTDAECAAL